MIKGQIDDGKRNFERTDMSGWNCKDIAALYRKWRIVETSHEGQRWRRSVDKRNRRNDACLESSEFCCRASVDSRHEDTESELPATPDFDAKVTSGTYRKVHLQQQASESMPFDNNNMNIYIALFSA